MKKISAILLVFIAVIQASPSSVSAACVAQALPKLSIQEYRDRVIEHFNTPMFSTLLEGRARLANTGTYPHTLRNNLNNAITNFYENVYDPRDIVCIANDAGAMSEADALNAFQGTKLILLPTPIGTPTKNDGLFGRDLELLSALQEIILRDTRAFRRSRGITRHDSPCGREGCIVKNQTNIILDQFTNAQRNFLPVAQLSYLEFPFLTGDVNSRDINEIEISRFYHRVASQSYIDNALGGSRPVTVQIGTSKVTFTTTLYDPTTIEFVSANSLLDFVEDAWISNMTLYYSELFSSLLVSEDNWKISVSQSSSLVNSERLVRVSQSNALSVGVADFYCALAQSNNGDIPYADLVAGNKRVYVGNHIAFFCDVFDHHGKTLLVAEEIMKTDHTFPTTLPVLAEESGNQDMLEQLNVLAELTIDQNDLLNDIKDLIGSEQFESKISNLQEAIRAAERAARGPGIGDIVDLAAAVGSLYPGIGQVASGALIVTSQLYGAANSPEGPAIYLINNQEALADGSRQIGEGAAKINKLIDSIDNLSASDRARSEVGGLRGQLEEVQKQYREFQQDIQRVTQMQQEQYLRAVETFELLRKRRSGIFLAVQTALNEASLKDLIGGHVAQAEPNSQKQCRQAADSFNASANETTFGSLNANCSRYLTAFSALAECVKSLPDDAEKYVEYSADDARVGLLLAREKGDAECLRVVQQRFQNEANP
ncbi:hypothetical protein GOB36_14270 [Sinorhizobium meliloti]|uniref:hypothetical protein n=1 Tax=Rhizobium meliloti TaxID=382 RepID=UPI00299E5D08|nr:hypothetical protein [Sinorhizobium meliloti]MDW9511252.1 hypothetical protein [Sinorhizobium meliloti]MDW9921698.1 hypothetical protein [Sinorhizobium meliloti]MDW9925995.1 hypothetical protein [Sinorhizobium meliloti]MDX0032844.1 hypothetical protein [Sinorhizobium meliloti]